MTVLAKNGMEVRILLRSPLVEPPEPKYEVELTEETEAQKKNKEVRKQEKRFGWENQVIKDREKGVLCK